MATLPVIKKKLEMCAAKNYLGHVAKKERDRQKYITDIDTRGGKGFVERVLKYGRTEKGASLKIDPWYLEYLEAIGDWRVGMVFTTGPSQVGKTLGHGFLMIDALTTGRLNGAWFYDTRTNLDQNVPIQFQPVAANWIASMERDGKRFFRGGDRAINTRYQVDAATAFFSYVSTSRTEIRGGEGAAAGSAVVSFQADFAILDERSQYAPGSADPIPRRLDASVLPTKPLRPLGTPGGGSGIEMEIETSDRHFYPHYECSNCGGIFPLDPKGCLLRLSTQTNALGKAKQSYFTESGRPGAWFHSDPDNPIDSAFIGCSNCHFPLPFAVRREVRFRCLRTKQTLREFLDSLENNYLEKYWKIAIHLSPLVRSNADLAKKLISDGTRAIVTTDWQQQALGHSSETENLSVTNPMLRLSIESPAPEDLEYDYRLAGIDVGRSSDWLVMIDYYMPENHASLSIAEIFENTIRVVRFAQDVVRSDIKDLLERNYVTYGLIDNEPSRESSMNLCRQTCLEMVNQVSGLKFPFKEVTVSDGGMDFSCWDIRSEKFMLSVFEGFMLTSPIDNLPLYRLPKSWTKWIGNPMENSPLVHLAGPWRGANGKWHRGKDNLDDIYMGFSFCEAAFYISLDRDRNRKPAARIGSYFVR